MNYVSLFENHSQQVEAGELKDFCSDHLIDLIDKFGKVLKIEVRPVGVDGVLFWYNIYLSFSRFSHIEWHQIKDNIIPFIEILPFNYRFYLATKTQKKNDGLSKKYQDIDFPHIEINDTLFFIDDIINDKIEDSHVISSIDINIKNKVKRLHKPRIIKKISETISNTDKETIKSFCEIHLIDLIDKGFRVNIYESDDGKKNNMLTGNSLSHINNAIIVISIPSKYFRWESLKDSILPFFQIIIDEYDLKNNKIALYVYHGYTSKRREYSIEQLLDNIDLNDKFIGRIEFRLVNRK